MAIRHELGCYAQSLEMYGETNDCGVRALMVAACIDYATAHALCAKHGRQERKGMLLRALRCAAQDAIGRALDTQYAHTTVAQFTKQFPIGHFIVYTQRHFFAICDGVVHNWKPAGRCRVQAFIQLC